MFSTAVLNDDVSLTVNGMRTAAVLAPPKVGVAAISVCRFRPICGA